MLLRLLGFSSFAIAALIAYLDSNVVGEEAESLSLGQLWFQLDKDSLQLAQPAVERHLDPAIWSGIVQPILEQSAVSAFCALGAFFLLAAWAISAFFRD